MVVGVTRRTLVELKLSAVGAEAPLPILFLSCLDSDSVVIVCNKPSYCSSLRNQAVSLYTFNFE